MGKGLPHLLRLGFRPCTVLNYLFLSIWQLRWHSAQSQCSCASVIEVLGRRFVSKRTTRKTWAVNNCSENWSGLGPNIPPGVLSVDCHAALRGLFPQPETSLAQVIAPVLQQDADVAPRILTKARLPGWASLFRGPVQRASSAIPNTKETKAFSRHA